VDIQKRLHIKGVGGIVMKVGDKWICNACGAEIGDTLYMQSAVINLKKDNWVEVDHLYKA